MTKVNGDETVNLRARVQAIVDGLRKTWSGEPCWALGVEDSAAWESSFQSISGIWELPRQGAMDDGNQHRLVLGTMENRTGFVFDLGRSPQGGLLDPDPALPVYMAHYFGLPSIGLLVSGGAWPAASGREPIQRIRDHVNITGDSPLIGHGDDGFGTRFIDMRNCYPDLEGPVSGGLHVFRPAAGLSQARLDVLCPALGPATCSCQGAPEVLAAARLGMAVRAWVVVTQEFTSAWEGCAATWQPQWRNIRRRQQGFREIWARSIEEVAV